MPPSLPPGFEHRVIVGIADLAVSNNPSVTLTTYSLGSCIAVAIHDPNTHVGGLLHLMLPDSSIDPAKASARPGMFADTGIPALFRAAYQLGALKHRLSISLAGGAQIMDNSGFFNIGRRNYDAVLDIFARHSLLVSAEHVGGLVNRTVHLHLGSGQLHLKVSGQSNTINLCTTNSTTTSIR